MEEKKLTDDELLRLLEIFAKDDEPNGVRLLAEGALDLIHRLQSEKKELKSIAEYQQGSNIERWRIIQEKDNVIAEQKKEIERLTKLAELRLRDNEDTCKLLMEKENQVDELKKERENVQKILYELGKCGNDEERYALWVKLIKYCGVEVE